MYYSKYRKRLERAIGNCKLDAGDEYDHKKHIFIKKYKKAETIEDFLDLLERKATTEKQLREIIWNICDLIEPANCTRSHCEHFTAYCFANCNIEIVPGRCKQNRKYLKNKRSNELEKQ